VPKANGSCIDTNVLIGVAYLYSVGAAITDLTIGLLPVALIDSGANTVQVRNTDEDICINARAIGLRLCAVPEKVDGGIIALLRITVSRVHAYILYAVIALATAIGLIFFFRELAFQMLGLGSYQQCAVEVVRV
jgi:hypothetical protein